MKKAFQTHSFIARHNQTTEMWDVFKNNIRLAVIYDDSREIKFVNTDTCIHIAELTELHTLIFDINKQYKIANP